MNTDGYEYGYRVNIYPAGMVRGATTRTLPALLTSLSTKQIFIQQVKYEGSITISYPSR